MSQGGGRRRNASDALTPDPALVQRFRGDVEALTGTSPAPNSLLGVAVSGGADSLALLLLATAAFPGAVAAATVDHRLRPEAATEAATAAAICEELEVPHDTLVVPPDMVLEGNLQDRARVARYLLLGWWGGSGTLRNEPPWRVAHIATGHQRDDVAESFLMRARRGAGVGGLAAMAAASRPTPMRGPPVIRPLLHWSRTELAAVVERAGLRAVVDPSNVHPRFDRSRIRRLLAAEPDLPPARLALAAHNLRHAEDALEWIADREWGTRHSIEAYETVWLDATGLPYELRRRLVRRAVDYIRFEFNVGGGWAGTGLDRLVGTLDRGKAGTLAGVAAVVREQLWRFRLAPPRRGSGSPEMAVPFHCH